MSNVQAHYDAIAQDYATQYDHTAAADPAREYPANYYRLQLLLACAQTFTPAPRVLDVGCGDGTPLQRLAEMGCDCYGFDVSANMISKTQAQQGIESSHIGYGDIEDAESYRDLLHDVPPFDLVSVMGVMPHVQDDDVVLANIAQLVRPGGHVFIEFRNMLFSLFTCNRHTVPFIVYQLMHGVAAELCVQTQYELGQMMQMDQPVQVLTEGSAPGYDAIPAKFHNPFESVEWLADAGFSDVQPRWYHFHPAPPWMEAKFPLLYRHEQVRLEARSTDWRAPFLCSTFVLEAVKR